MALSHAKSEPRFRRPWKLYGALCLAGSVALVGVQAILFLQDSEFMNALIGFLFLVGLGLVGYGVLDRNVISKDCPAHPHPKLIWTAWGLLGAGVLLLMLSMTQMAILAAKRASAEAQAEQAAAPAVPSQVNGPNAPR